MPKNCHKHQFMGEASTDKHQLMKKASTDKHQLMKKASMDKNQLMRKASTDKHQLMNKALTDKDMSMDMLNNKLSIDNNRSIRRQNDRESKVQSGADMVAESEFVDSGRFLENRSMPDMETISRKQIIDSICLFLKWTSYNQV